MRRAQIIKDSLYDYLSEIGYSYISDRNIWVFRKEEGEITKEIAIYDMYGEAVDFDFRTTVGGAEGIPYMDSSKVRLNDQGFCDYRNEEEFRILIDEIKRIIMTRGEEIFNEISVISEEQRLTWDMEKEFFESYEQLIESGSTFLKIKNETGEEKLKIIIEQLKKLHGKSVQEVRKELLMLAALYGQIYMEEFEGEWKYINRYCVMDYKGGKFRPLEELILYWKCNDDEKYKIIISNYFYYRDVYNASLKQRKSRQEEVGRE